MRRPGLALLVLFLLPLGVMSQVSPDQTNAPDAQSVVGVPQGPPLTGARLEVRTKEVAGLLRCPVCQGLSVYDSPASMAVNMKHQVRDLLGRGFTQEQILKYFEHSYGEFVLLEPPFRGVNWLVWLAPAIMLIGGGVLIYFAVQRLREGGPVGVLAAPAVASEGLPDPNRLPDDAELARHVLRVREMAYGWPGGVAPKTTSEGTNA
jgi:cytochrome c-type biogenesis protein CcmH